jgi:Raf kinase inhibitor-like YbhB/YbcL family protein
MVPAALIWRILVSTVGPLGVSSPAFEADQRIPREYSCAGRDQSPRLQWTDGPAGTKSYALIVEDPDAPGGTFVHWLLYDYVFDPMLALSRVGPNLQANVPKTATVSLAGLRIAGDPKESVLKQGMNDFGRLGYGGPCPPPGAPHHYLFHVFALDRVLGLAPGASAEELRQAMRGHVLATGQLVGLFGR